MSEDEGRAAFTRAFYAQVGASDDKSSASLPVEDDERVENIGDAAEPSSGTDGIDGEDNLQQGGEPDVDGSSEDATDSDREETDEGTSGLTVEAQVESSGDIESDIADDRVEETDTTNERSGNTRTFAAIPHVYDFEP